MEHPNKHNSLIELPESGNGWMDQELQNCHFKDSRQRLRFRKLLEQMSHKLGESIPMACQDWANTKAAYRFFSNESITEAEILGGHLHSTAQRFASVDGRVLVLHDTCEFTFQRDPDAAVGLIGLTSGKTKDGRQRHHTVRGILMHSSLVVTPEGVPLGIAAIKLWTRKKFKGCNALKRKVNPTRIPIEEKESIRWLDNLRESTARLARPADCIHIGDRESDIYELFCAAEEIGTHFLVRTCVDRLAGDGGHTIAAEMEKVRSQGVHRIEVRNKKGDVSEARLKIQYKRIRVLPPIGKQKKYPGLDLTVIHAREIGNPRDRDRIEWKLITNLPIKSLSQAIEKLEWYAMRWKIETFHKILKSGCKAQDSKLRTSERLANFIAVLCILSWRIFWMTMVNRTAPSASPETVITPQEIYLLDQLIEVKPWKASHRRTLSDYLIKIARLGGYLARASDPPPGNMVMWRGLSRLTDIQLGFAIGRKNCG